MTNAEMLRSAQHDNKQVAKSFASQKLCGFPDLIERTADFEKAEFCATLLAGLRGVLIDRIAPTLAPPWLS